MADLVLVSRDGSDAVVLGSDGLRAVMRAGVWSDKGPAYGGEDWVLPEPKRAAALSTDARNALASAAAKPQPHFSPGPSWRPWSFDDREFMVDPEQLEALERTSNGWVLSVPARVVCRDGEPIKPSSSSRGSTQPPDNSGSPPPQSRMERTLALFNNPPPGLWERVHAHHQAEEANEPLEAVAYCRGRDGIPEPEPDAYLLEVVAGLRRAGLPEPIPTLVAPVTDTYFDRLDAGQLRLLGEALCLANQHRVRPQSSGLVCEASSPPIHTEKQSSPDGAEAKPHPWHETHADIVNGLREEISAGHKVALLMLGLGILIGFSTAQSCSSGSDDGFAVSNTSPLRGYLASSHGGVLVD